MHCACVLLSMMSIVLCRARVIYSSGRENRLIPEFGLRVNVYRAPQVRPLCTWAFWGRLCRSVLVSRVPHTHGSISSRGAVRVAFESTMFPRRRIPRTTEPPINFTSQGYSTLPFVWVQDHEVVYGLGLPFISIGC